MSMRPGSNVSSPSSTTSASSGTFVGATSTMCSPSTNNVPGVTYSPRVTSSRHAARSKVGGCGVRVCDLGVLDFAAETLLSYIVNAISATEGGRP